VDGVEVPVINCVLDVDVASDVRLSGGWMIAVLAVLVRVDINVYVLTAIDKLLRSLTAVIGLAGALLDVDLFAELRLWTRRRAAGSFEDLDVFGVGFAALSRLDVEGEFFVVFLPPCL
jgi:hypothetical protein